jgi:hypothetical protein
MSNRTPWEDIIWTPEPILAGETVFILASGPSLNQETVDRLRGRKVIAINCTAVTFKFDWPVIWFFTDNNIFEDYRDAVMSWPGDVIALSRAAKREAGNLGMPDKIKRVMAGEWSDCFPPAGSPFIRSGRSSGHSAVALAVALAAKRGVLLGYDMRVVEGREHHHEEYKGRPRDLDIYEREFIPGFQTFVAGNGQVVPGWNELALRVGVEIVNATPGSALKEFPMVDLDEVLSDA